MRSYSYDFGFLSEVVRIDHSACGPDLTYLWSALKGLAEVIHPNVFTILWDKLTKLTDTRARNFPPADCGSESEVARVMRESIARVEQGPDLEPVLEKAVTPAEVRMYAWSDLSRSFHKWASQALPHSSPDFRWFSCGRCLGEWVTLCAIHDEPPVWRIQEKVRAFQQSVLRLPAEFRSKAAWLGRMADFDFHRHNAAELSGLMRTPREPDRERPEHENYRVQLGILHDTLCEEVVLFVPGYPAQQSGGEGTATVQEWRLGYLDLEFDQGSRRVRRKGVQSEPVDFSAHNLLWHVLLKLEANKSTLLHYQAFSSVWKEHGQDDQVTAKRVTDAMCSLRSLLRPLRIDPKASRKAGWCLVDTDVPAKPESKQCRRPSRRKRR